MRNKRGFTLIELLAVIVILAVIALIVTPIVTGIISSAKASADLRSAEAYVKAGETYFATATLDSTKKATLGTNVIDSLEVSNKQATGTVIVNKDGSVAMAIKLNNKCYIKTKIQSLSEITVTNDTTCSLPSVWTYVDSNSNGTKDVGDVITVGTESFYIISNDGTNIKAIAKYNLKVGGYYDGSTVTAYSTSEVTNLQDSEMKGWTSTTASTTAPRKGVTAFSTTSTAYTGSIVEGYVNTYKTKLEGMGATINAATLITKEELVTLGCVESTNTCSAAPSFVSTTTYWSGSAGVANRVWDVVSDGFFGFDNYGIDNGLGVRPVITISPSSI